MSLLDNIIEQASATNEELVRLAVHRAYQLGLEQGATGLIPDLLEYFPNVTCWQDICIAIEQLQDRLESLEK